MLSETGKRQVTREFFYERHDLVFDANSAIENYVTPGQSANSLRGVMFEALLIVECYIVDVRSTFIPAFSEIEYTRFI